MREREGRFEYYFSFPKSKKRFNLYYIIILILLLLLYIPYFPLIVPMGEEKKKERVLIIEY